MSLSKCTDWNVACSYLQLSQSHHPVTLVTIKKIIITGKCTASQYIILYGIFLSWECSVLIILYPIQRLKLVNH